MCVQLMLSEQVLAQWWHPVASSKALDLPYWAMRLVLYRHIAMAIKTASKVGVCFHHCVFDCRPSGHQGNTKQVVTQWRLPGASSVSLDMLHRKMPRSLLPHVRMSIKMARDRGTFACRHHLFCLL